MPTAPQTLFDKLWQRHVVDQTEDGETLLYIDRHLVYEVTSPQAFEGLRLAGRRPWQPFAWRIICTLVWSRTFAIEHAA